MPKGYKTAKVRAREAGRAEALREEHITAKRMMLEAARVALADRTQMWQNGRLLPVEDWPVDLRQLLEGSETIIKNAEAGDGHTDTVHKVHLARKWPAIEALMKHFGLISDRVEIQVQIGDRLRAARRRLADHEKS